MSRALLNQINLTKSEIDHSTDILITSVCRSESGPDGFQFIDDLSLLDLYFKDSVNYNSYADIVRNNGVLFLSRQFYEKDDIAHDFYKLRLTANPYIPVVYPRSGVNYDEFNHEINPPTKEGFVDLIYSGEYSYAHKIKFNNRAFHYGNYIVLNKPNFGLILIWFGSSSQVPPDGLTMELFSSGFRIDTEGSTDESALISRELSDLKRVIEGQGYKISYFSDSEKEIRFYYKDPFRVIDFKNLSVIPNDSLDKIDPPKENVFSTDEDFNYDALVRVTESESLIEFTSKIRGPRVTDLKIDISKNKFNNNFILRVSLNEYSEDYREQYELIPSVIDAESRIIESDIISNDSNLLSKLKEGSYEFLRSPESLLNEDYLDRLKSQYSTLDGTSYLIGLILDDGIENADYHSYLNDLAKKLDCHALISIDRSTIENDDRGFRLESDKLIAFTQGVSVKGSKLFSYSPFLNLYCKGNYLGNVSSYLVDDKDNVMNVNFYIRDEYTLSLDKLITTDREDVVKYLVIGAFTKRFSSAIEGVISLDDYIEPVNKILKNCLTKSPLLDSVELESIVKSGKSLNLVVSLNSKQLLVSQILLNFNINL